MGSFRPPDARSGFLIVMAMTIAAQVPLTIADIADPALRYLAQFSALLMALAFAWKAKPPVEPERFPQSSIPDTGVITKPETPDAKKRE